MLFCNNAQMDSKWTSSALLDTCKRNSARCPPALTDPTRRAASRTPNVCVQWCIYDRPSFLWIPGIPLSNCCLASRANVCIVSQPVLPRPRRRGFVCAASLVLIASPRLSRRHRPPSSSTFRLNLVCFYYKSTRNDARFRVGFRNGRSAFGAKYALWRHQSAKDADVSKDHEEDAEGGLGEERGQTWVAGRVTRGRRRKQRTRAGLFARFLRYCATQTRGRGHERERRRGRKRGRERRIGGRGRERGRGVP